MKSFIVLSGIVLLLGVGGGVIFWLQQQAVVVVPKFSEYEAQSAELLEKSKQTPSLVPFSFDLELATTTSYPASQLEGEIDYLVSRAVERNQEEQKYIEQLIKNPYEVSVTNGILNTLVTPTERIYSKEIIDTLWTDIEHIVAAEQLRFDIARPMQVDVKVNSPIKTPGSPSFPSELAAKLEILRVLFETLKYEDGTFYEASDNALDDLLVYGLNTRPDIEYGKALADAYFNKVMMAHPNFREFVGLLQAREWSTNPVVPIAEGPLPDVVVGEQSVEQAPQGIVFKARVQNIGIASTPQNYPVILEIDIYGDGSIDSAEPFEAAQLYGDTASEVSYFTNISREGEHQYRFIVDPAWVMPETKKLNNMGRWTSFSL